MADQIKILHLYHEMSQLRKKIASYYNKAEKERKRLQKIEEAIGELQSKKSEVESGMEETLKEIENRISRVVEKNRMTDSYCEKVKKAIYGSQFEEAMEYIRKGLKECEKDYDNSENTISEYKAKIKELEKQLSIIERQIEEEERM